MTRSCSGTLALWSLVPLLASLGCDALTVRPFSGTVMQFTVSGVEVTPPGQHLELWARTQYNDIVRVDGFTDFAKFQTAYGFMIRQAISLKDPCMIDPATGNLLTSPAAYPTTIVENGVTQTPAQQAQQITDRIKQLLADLQGNPLQAVLPYTPTAPPSIPDTATAAERKLACDAYAFGPSADPLTYVANPKQLTAPLHGAIYGFPKFVSYSPPQNYNGFRVDSPLNLKGVQELFFTIEGSTVDPKHRGPLFLTSVLSQGGRDVVHFDLVHADPNGTASGAVALYVNLNEDPVQF